MQAIENKLINRVYCKGRGWAFSKKDFGDLGASNAIDQALSRLVKKHTLRRVIKGIYDYPKYSKLFKKNLGPDIDQVAQALARKNGWRIQVSGNAALNIVGLSTQVPANYVYLSDARPRRYNIENVELQFKKASFKDLGVKHVETALLVQALIALNQRKLSQEQQKILCDYFDAPTRKRIVKDAQYATAWVYELIKTTFKDR